MKSKRKQVNKYNFRQHQESKESELEQYLRRTSGIKPFQLAKLRQAQRFSMDLAHANNQILHKRIGSNNLYDEDKDVYLDLIIKQKLIVDGNVNQKLESERKKIVSLKTDEHEVEPEKVTLGYLESNPQLLVVKEEEQCKVYTCQSPQSQNIIEKNAMMTYSVSERHPQPSQQQKRIDQAKNEIRLMKQKALPPFSFTSTKWRSKSQILQVDKWKQKYGKEIHQNQLKEMEKSASLSKMDSKTRANRIKQVRAQIHSHQSQKVSLPILRKQRQLESKAKMFKLTSKSAKHEEVIKIRDDAESYFLLTRDSLKKKSSQSKKKHSEEAEKGEIAIKKMYEVQEEAEQPITIEVNTQDTERREEQSTPSDKPQKSKKKKSKFPQIQITTFYSSKEQEIEKRRMKLQSIQRIARQWRYQPPKKIFLEKMMEEIPERWQYGDSRGSSRGGQVDNYLKIKEEQALFQKSQKDIEQQEAQLQKGAQAVQIKQ